MKKASVLLSIILVLINSFTTVTVALESDKSDKDNYSIAEKQKKTEEQIISQFNEKEFGGAHYEDGVLVVNLTDNAYKRVKLLKKSDYGIDVIYHKVDLSLDYLESVMETLIPYMVDYDIVLLDANDITNILDVGVYLFNEDLENLISQFISLDYVNIYTIPQDTKYKFT